MKPFTAAVGLALSGVFWFSSPPVIRASDVAGYSLLKGQFLIQTGPGQWITDPLFGYSLLASVELTDFYLVTNASLSLPGGGEVAMDDLGDSWDYLDTFSTLSSLNADYGWGNYVFNLSTVNDGDYSCELRFPSTPLPPTPHLVNFADVQAVLTTAPLVLNWDFAAPPAEGDFVQVYINLGHGEVFSTPDVGMPGALDATARFVTVPAGTLEPGNIYSLTLEITRLVSTNATTYPEVTGVAGTFSSTSIDLITLMPPILNLPSGPTNGIMTIEVQAEPGETIILQSSDLLDTWRNLATNSQDSVIRVFSIPVGQTTAAFFRAYQP
ncbi:MAG TPA: hypothetical protein P5186_05505 [Candidatus Paceibacterota bacterium]|nr:hypothetical protein [Verrucomicrobiota bacterium]HRY47484.1 hypothetical protein [Candidatus Paceibacterota bacterium]HSA00343.1 hypothetical protein [Candidatus Paceibacterota bacterium]